MIRRRFYPVLFGVLLLAMPLAACGDSGESKITVTGAWARASATVTGAAYATIANAGSADDVLVAVRSPAAEKAEIHDMMMDGMVMKMRKLDTLAVGAGESVTLAPGGKHIMLIRLKEPLTAGMSVPLTLVFEKAGEIEISAPVQPAGHSPS